MIDDYDEGSWIDCWQCGGVGMTAGCFEDCCSGADCDPDDAELCCCPSTCDVCHGKGGWHQDEPEEIAPPDATDAEARDTLVRALGGKEAQS